MEKPKKPENKDATSTEEAAVEEVLVTVKALKVLRGTDGKKVPVGKTTDVTKEASVILVKNKQAELVKEG